MGLHSERSNSRGSHALKFGAEFRQIRFPFFQVPYPHGELNLNQNDTAFPSLTANLNALTGEPVASFLLGNVGGGQISTGKLYFVPEDWLGFLWPGRLESHSQVNRQPGLTLRAVLSNQ